MLQQMMFLFWLSCITDSINVTTEVNTLMQQDVYVTYHLINANRYFWYNAQI